MPRLALMSIRKKMTLLVLAAMTLAGCAGGEDGEQEVRDGTAGDGDIAADAGGEARAGGDSSTGEGATDSAEGGVSVEFVGEDTTYLQDDFDGQTFVVLTKVKNTGDTNARGEVTATFYDADGNILGTQNSYLPGLTPGAEWPLRIATPYDMDASGADVADYKLTLSPSEAWIFEPAPQGTLDIISDNLQPAKYGGYKVLGEVENTGSQNVDTVQVAAIFYDAEGNVIDVSSATADPFKLQPGTAGAFEIDSFRDDREPTRYELFVTADLAS